MARELLNNSESLINHAGLHLIILTEWTEWKKKTELDRKDNLCLEIYERPSTNEWDCKLITIYFNFIISFSTYVKCKRNTMLYFLKNLEEGNRFYDEALLYLALNYGLAR